jgi:Ca-activated chloride channel family protein
MQSPDKLGLLKSSMKMLARRMAPEDRLAIAVYAGAAGTVLESTPGSERAKILSAIDQLTAGGSTNGGAGIRLAYSLAEQGFMTDGINRVILATDGDFNVGTTDTEALKNLIEARRESGVALTVLGFGGGNYNDALMQELAQIGNGNAAYIDTLNEARKVLVEEIGATLNMIAKDVKIQIEFNPGTVAEYRLIGYETRHLEREDFNNDKVDAGDIGAGHTVTALYEIALTGSEGKLIDPLRYGDRPAVNQDAADGELAFLKLRYKLPASDTSRLITEPVTRDQIIGELDRTSDNYRFAAAVAGFGQILRGGEYTGEFDLDAVVSLAGGARGDDAYGYRGEFLGMVRTADALAVHQNDDSDAVATR